MNLHKFILISPSSLGFYNCLIEGGKEGFTGATFTGAYENCIDTVPQFAGSNDYHLQNTSPCIGAAIDSIQIGSTRGFIVLQLILKEIQDQILQVQCRILELMKIL